MLLRPDETIETFPHLYQEFKDAYELRIICWGRFTKEINNKKA